MEDRLGALMSWDAASLITCSALPLITTYLEVGVGVRALLDTGKRDEVSQACDEVPRPLRTVDAVGAVDAALT